MTTTAERAISKPTLFEVIEGRNDVSLVRLALTSRLPIPLVRTAVQANATTPAIASRIVAGLGQLTGHKYSVHDINMIVGD